MAVEYEISSDVATIKGVASNTQVASIVKFYTGSITYDDEPTSKYASVTINGKTQRVMLCVAVSGTATYDDVPCLYSTVSGHRTLNVVEPTETGTPDDVPSLYETVVVDGKTVRALRCVLINATPNYDGVSSTCTFTDNGKTHTAQLVNKIVGGSVEVIVKGVSPLSLPDAVAGSLSYVKAFGGTEQRSIPAEYTQLAYIESTGTQYIDLGYKGNGNTKVDVKFKYHTASSATGSGRVFGSRTSAQNNAFAIGSASGTVPATATNKVFWCYDNQNYFTIEENFGLDVWKTVVFSATEHSVDGVTAGDDYNIVEFETPQNLKLFGFDNNGTMGVGDVDVAYCKLWDNGVLVRDLVPARRNSDNVLGMYDTVTGNFLTNAGAGTFAAGGEAVPTPDKPMDIVSNNGVLKYSKNLLDMATENIVLGKYINNSGVISDSAPNFYNSKYIPVVAGETYTWSTSGSIKYLSIMEYDSSKTFVKRTLFGSLQTEAGTSGTLTLGSTTTYVLLGSNMFTGSDAITLDDILAVDWQFEKGASATAYKPYGSIYTDGTVETINVHGKNLYNSATRTDGYYIGADGVIAQGSGTFCYSALIPVKPNTKYMLSGIASQSNSRRLHAYDSNGNWISQISFDTISAGNTYNITGTTPNNCVYVRISMPMLDTNVQLEQGSTATAYEPYYNGGTATAEILLKVGDYQDVQSIIDGAITRNVGVKVLDGTEDWVLAGSGGGLRCHITEDIGLPNTNDLTSPMMCSHYGFGGYVSGGSATTVGTFNAFSRRDPGNESYYLRFSIVDMGITTASEFKSWLADQYAAGTPVIVIYPLAEPTTESVTGQTLQVQAGNNTLEITQASLNGLELEAEYQAAVSLTIQEVQDANLDPNVEVTIN